MKRTWNLDPVLQIVQKIPESYCSCLYLSTGQVWWLNDLWFKIYIQKCTLLHVLIFIMISDFVNHGMVKNAETWISWEWNITFLRNEKILNLCLIWHIFRSYFVADVTFELFERPFAITSHKDKSNQRKPNQYIYGCHYWTNYQRSKHFSPAGYRPVTTFNQTENWNYGKWIIVTVK